MNYLIIFFGSVLGMLLLTTVKSVYVQRGSKYTLGFVGAFKVYTTKHTGPMLVGFIVVLIAMFVLPDTLALAESGRAAGTKYAMIVDGVLDRLRLYSVFLGIIGQGLGFILIRKGEKFLREQEVVEEVAAKKSADE